MGVLLTEVDEDVRFERDSEWLSSRYRELQVDYPNKYVAILDNVLWALGMMVKDFVLRLWGNMGGNPSSISSRIP